MKTSWPSAPALRVILWLGVFSSGSGLPGRAEGIYSNSWVRPSLSGNLLYRHDAQGVRICDFSDCGYKEGAQELPDAEVVVPQRDRWTYVFPSNGASDADAIQQAIDRVGTNAPNSMGFRGVVFLTSGEYRVERTLFVTNSGIILKGVGTPGNLQTTIRATAKSQYNLIAVTGLVERTFISPDQLTIINPVVPAGSRTFKLFDVRDLRVGDTILVTRPFTANWISEIDMDQLAILVCPPQATSTNQCVVKGLNWDTRRKLVFERKVTRIEGLWVTVDSPLAQTFDLQYGGGFVQKTSWPERIQDLGIEDLQLVSDYGDDDDEDHGWTAINVSNAQDVWVRNVVGKHFGMSLVNMSAGTRHTTVAECQSFDPISELTGNRRYPFHMEKGDHHLMRDNYSDDGRHDFAFGSLVPGPNATVRSQSHESHADSGPHMGWSVGGLYDLISLDASWGAGFLDKVGVNVQNRGRNTKNHGWAGAYMAVWNCVAPNFRVRNPPTARNWLVGSIGNIYDSQWWLPPVGDDPEGTYEWSGPPIPLPGQRTIGRHVDPYSLYFAQLQQRLKYPQSEFREYRLGDIDGFGSVPSPEDKAPVDPAFLRAVQQNSGNLTVTQNFDVAAPNRQLAFTFSVPLPGAEKVVAASLVLCVKAVGSIGPLDALLLDSATVGTPFQGRGLGWELRKDRPTVETLEIDPAMLADGQLNVSVKQNVSVDWAVLHVQVSTAAVTELALPPVADAYVRGGSHKKENFATDPALWVKNEGDGDFSRRAYLSWALPSIPDRVVGAKVRLYCNGTGDPQNVFYVARAVHDDWNEGGLTWINQPGNLPPFAYLVPGKEGYLEFSVLPQALDAMQRHRRLPLQIWAPYDLGDAGFASFASREVGDASLRPQLILQLRDEPPTLSRVTNMTMTANSTLGPVPIVVGDAETAAGALVLTASSSNPALFGPGGLTLGGSGTQRTLILHPIADRTGVADITLRLSDGKQALTQTFKIQVGPPGDPPVLSVVPTQNLLEHTPSPRIPFTITDSLGHAAEIEASVAPSFSSRRPQLSIAFGFDDSTTESDPKVSHRFLTITPLPGFVGASRVTLQISDGFHLVNQLLTVQVSAIDDPPGPIRLEEPHPGTRFPTNQPIVLRATIEDVEADLLRVEFYNHTNLVGIATSAPYQTIWKHPEEGPQVVTATAVDKAGHRTTSDAVVFEIGEQPESPPLIAVRPDDGGLQISWEVESGRFRVQSTDSLREPVVWVDVNRVVSSGGGTTFVPLAPGRPERFFRLVEVP